MKAKVIKRNGEVVDKGTIPYPVFVLFGEIYECEGNEEDGTWIFKEGERK